MSTFEDLFARWKWKPIANCPGRFRLTGQPPELTPVSIAGSDLTELEFKVAGAKDPVIVTPLGDGSGLISYRRSARDYLHTLNTPEGFARKLSQLGITIPGNID